MLLSSPSPGPPRSSRSSRQKSPRPHDVHSYLNDIAQRKGNFSLRAMSASSTTGNVNSMSPPTAEHIDCRPISGFEEEDIFDVNKRPPIPYSSKKDTTAKVLFEKSTDQTVINEISSNQFREFSGNSPEPKNSSNIILQHTMKKRGRSVDFIIREHTERNVTTFSVHVHSSKQKFTFHVPPSQELIVLLKLWGKHPISKDFLCIACNIIKSTNISFTGQRIDSIFFKDRGFTVKIKKEATKILTSMAIIIQKYVRRYLVLLTSSYHANKVAKLYHPPLTPTSPENFSPQHMETPFFMDKNVRSSDNSPVSSPTYHEKVNNFPTFSDRNEQNPAGSPITMEDAIRAQAEAHKEISVNNQIRGNTSTPYSTSGLSHSEKVAKLIEERKRAQAKEREQKLSKKKREREFAKAKRLAETEQKKKVEKKSMASVGSSIVALLAATKLKTKAGENIRAVERAKLAEAEALQEEETAKAKAIRNAVLNRKNSTYTERVQPSYKEFHVKNAKEKENMHAESGGIANGESKLLKSDSLEKQQLEDTKIDDATNSISDKMTPEEIFRMKIAKNERLEKLVQQKGIEALEEVSRKDFTPESIEKKQPEDSGKAVLPDGMISLVEDKKELPKFDEMLPPHLFDKYFDTLQEYESLSKADMLSLFKQMDDNKFFNTSSIHAIESDMRLISWMNSLFSAILHHKNYIEIVLIGLHIVSMFPFERLHIPEHRVSFCGIIGKVLSPHIELEDFCTRILQYGAKFTSKDTVHNLEHAVDNEGLEMILKILLKYGQEKDVVGNAPKVVVSCLKYIRNVCIASSPHIQERLMAAGVGTCLIKLLVFYKSDESVVNHVCRSVASLIKNPSYLAQFASVECINLYMLILKTNPMNKSIAKTVGVLLVELYTASPDATKSSFCEGNFPSSLNNLLLSQMDLSSRFSLSVIECNVMMASFFIIQVSYLKSEFLKLNVHETLLKYKKNQQNFGKNIDVVIQKCLKHLSPDSCA